MSVTITQALEIIELNVKNNSFIIIPILESAGFVSASKYLVTYPLPRFNNSAMDGYGVLQADQGKDVNIIDEIFAGDNKNCVIQNSQCIKITTGARVPKSVEAIIPQEDIKHNEDKSIKLPLNIKKNAHIRYIGEDVKIGDSIIEVGDKITPAHIALLSSQGISYIKVIKKAKVAIFATGEELKFHFESIEQHQIYNSNAPHLYTRVKELGVDVDFIGHAGDDLETIIDVIRGLKGYDLIITSGGVSVGEKDFTNEAFVAVGYKELFCKIDIKPGKPTMFGTIDNTYVLNLPGNPLAAMSIFEMFGTIIIKRLQNDNQQYHNIIIAKLKTDLTIKEGRSTIITGFFDGEYFEPSKKRAPGMVSVLSKANSFIITSETTSILNKNKRVKVIPINWEFYSNIKKNIYTS